MAAAPRANFSANIGVSAPFQIPRPNLPLRIPFGELESISNIFSQIDQAATPPQEMVDYLKELHNKYIAAQNKVGPSLTALEGAQQAPMPQLQPPGIHPLAGLGALMGGGMAAALTGNQSYAQAPMQHFQGMQQQALKSAEQQREENLKILEQAYIQKRDAAIKMGDLEASTQAAEKFERLKTIREKKLEVLKDREDTENKRADMQAQWSVERAKFLADTDNANWRASLGASKGGATPEDILKLWQAGLGQMPKEKVAAGNYLRNLARLLPFTSNFRESALVYANLQTPDGKPLFNPKDKKSLLEFHRLIAEKDPTGAFYEAVVTGALSDPKDQERAYNNGQWNTNFIADALMRGPQMPGIPQTQPETKAEKLGKAVIDPIRQTMLDLTGPLRMIPAYLGTPADSTFDPTPFLPSFRAKGR